MQWDPNIEISDDPLESSWQLAAIAPLGQLDQLRLLRSTTVGGLLRELIDLTLAAEPVLTTTADDDEFDEALVNLLDEDADDEADDDDPDAARTSGRRAELSATSPGCPGRL